MKVLYSGKSIGLLKFAEKARDASIADKFRRLKELAVQSRDHEREQDFFAKELKAKRFYETTGFALVWSYLYEWFSDFGRSVSRPFFSLFGLWLICAIGYWYSTSKYLDFVTRIYLPTEKLLEALKLLLATIVPFFAISREEFHDSKSAITGDNVSLLLDFAMVFEGILAVIFIFLIGLALRNRFRI